jgi:hypothetical protein
MREWYECLHKAAPLVAAADRPLIMNCLPNPWPRTRRCWRPGSSSRSWSREARSFVWLPILARLDRSWPRVVRRRISDDLASAAYDLVQRHPNHPRLALRIVARPTEGGLDVKLDTRPLGPRPVSSTLRYHLRPDCSWRHKWIERSALDVAEGGGHPDLPFFTSQGWMDITETSRGNIFIQDEHGSWCTPPLGRARAPRDNSP